MDKFGYTVGATTNGFYIQIPWHLRGTAAELMAAFTAQHAEMGLMLPDNCQGFEFRDDGVQIQRYKFAWVTDG